MLTTGRNLGFSVLHKDTSTHSLINFVVWVRPGLLAASNCWLYSSVSQYAKPSKVACFVVGSNRGWAMLSPQMNHSSIWDQTETTSSKGPCFGPHPSTIAMFRSSQNKLYQLWENKSKSNSIILNSLGLKMLSVFSLYWIDYKHLHFLHFAWKIMTIALPIYVFFTVNFPEKNAIIWKH